MKKIYTYLLPILITALFAQDSRSTIFSTGTPDTDEGYLISGDYSVADRFSVPSNYAMEGFRITMSSQSLGSTMTISIHNDNDNSPGNILGSWDLPIISIDVREYLVYTFQDCILFDAGNNYWISVKAADSSSSAKWIYSPDDFYTYSESSDQQSTWSSTVGQAGSAKIYAEAFYYSPDLLGDVNLDQTVNILDVVTLVSYVIGDQDLNTEQFNAADINIDESVDVLDIVQIVSTIINSQPMASFSLLDFNPNSEYYDTLIGPDFFNGQVSCYYFGKQG